MKQSESAGGVVVNGDEVVLVLDDGNHWNFPKGRVRDGERKLECARREIYEETGISELEFVKELGSYQRMSVEGDELKIITLFLFRTDQKELSPKDLGITDAKWVSKEEVDEVLTIDEDKEFFSALGL